MRSAAIFAAPFLLLLAVMLIAMAGCGGTTGVTAVSPTVNTTTTSNPAPSPSPNSPPAKAPMGAFIEDVGVVAFTTSTRYMYTATNNGTGFTKVGTLHDYHSVYVLPDGSKGVFSAQAADGNSQIYYLAPVDSTAQPVQLTTTPIDKTGAVLSYDGSKIVFLQLSPGQTDPDGGRVWDVAIMDANGSNITVIAHPQGWYFSHPFPSPDATKIVVALYEGGFGGDMGIFTMNANGANLTRVTPGGIDGILAVAPAFSPDGAQVVFSSVGWNDLSIYIINVDGTSLKRLGPANARWGDPLFVGDRIMFVSGSEIYSMKADGTDVTRITNNSYNDAFEMGIK